MAGAKVSDPGADLGMCLAIASAVQDKALPIDLVAIGEVALSGDIRPVPGITQRLNEAARLGFATALVPRGTKLATNQKGLKLIQVDNLTSALKVI